MDIHVDPIDLQTVYNDGVVEDTEFWQKRGQPPGYPTPLHPLVQVQAPGGASIPHSDAAPALIHSTVPTNIQIYEYKYVYRYTLHTLSSIDFIRQSTLIINQL